MAKAYREAGVDVEAGYEAVERIKKHVATTLRPEVLSKLGSFGASVSLKSFSYEEPVLVSGTDGVGTKLLIAINQQKYDTIGIDCVAMCVNDILTQGAEPLFFLDYLAVNKNRPEIIEELVKGICEGCRQAGAALVGGETAEMPGVYSQGDFDMAGFAVGIGERQRLIDLDQVQEGDYLIGLASSGIHSNGYSLVRKILLEDYHFNLSDKIPCLSEDQTLGEILLTPTRIYVKSVLPLIQKGKIHSLAHITGGGFIENVPRMLPKGLKADIQLGSFDCPALFDFLEEKGKIPHRQMYEIFNMGIGMVLAVGEDDLEEVQTTLTATGEKVSVIGRVKKRSDNESAVRLEEA